MDYQTITFERRNWVAHITLNRPKQLNALNLQMARELMYAALECDSDRTIRAVHLSGAGTAFCAGGDLDEFASAENTAPVLLKEMTTHLHAAISRFARMDAPLVVAVNGTAAGAGMSLVCIGDLAFAAQSARFSSAYQRVGLTPDGSSTYYLARLVGLRRAQELILTSRVLKAAEAEQWGLINGMVKDDELLAETSAIAAKLATGPTWAIGRTKQLLLAGGNEALESQMEAESRSICDAARTDDFREGLDAFLSKRSPNFSGR